MADPLGRAMLHFQRGRHRGNCYHRDGDAVWDGNVYGFYFRPPEAWPAEFRELLDELDGPVLDAGCGAGRVALYLQGRGRGVVAIDVSPHAVRAAQERGVADARVMDMFDLELPPDRFRSVLVVGTQTGLAGSLAGVRKFLADLARVTTPDARVVVDSYDPAEVDGPHSHSRGPHAGGGSAFDAGSEVLPGFRPDPRDGLARRAFHVEYEYPTGDGWTREVGRTLDFLLFSPERLREAAERTPWRVTDVRRRGSYYRAVLTGGASPAGDTR